MIDNEIYSIILPGRIIAFFEEEQTATVRVCVENVYDDPGSNLNLEVRKDIEGVPVHVLSGGGWSLTMPIKTGDTCILFFSQVGYDHWLYDDKDVAGTLANLPKPWLGRQFNEDDGFALVGLNTLPRAIDGYSNEHSQWRNEDKTQLISLNKNGSIDIESDREVNIDAPIVNVEASISATVTAPIVNVEASTSATVTAPIVNVEASGKVTVDASLVEVIAVTKVVLTAPIVECSAILKVGGAIIAAGPISSPSVTAAAVTAGALTATGAITAGALTATGAIAGLTVTETATGKTLVSRLPPLPSP